MFLLFQNAARPRSCCVSFHGEQGREVCIEGLLHNTALRDETRYQMVWRDVEGRVATLHVSRRDEFTVKMRYFVILTFFDYDVPTCRRVKIKRGRWTSHVERNIEMTRDDRKPERANLVRKVAVGRDAVSANNHHIDQFLRHD